MFKKKNNLMFIRKTLVISSHVFPRNVATLQGL